VKGVGRSGEFTGRAKEEDGSMYGEGSSRDDSRVISITDYSSLEKTGWVVRVDE